MVIGNTKSHSTVVYKKENSRILKGLKLIDGIIKWFDVQHFGNFYCDVAAIDTGFSFRYINRQAEFIGETDYLIGDDFRENFAFVSDYSRTFLLNSDAARIKTFEENYITNKFNNGIAIVARIDSTGNYKQCAAINSLGEFVVPFGKDIRIHSQASFKNPNDDYSNGLLRFEENEKYGFKSLQNEVIIPPIYDVALKFSEGLSAVQIGGQCGFINTEGKEVIPFEFELANSFREGIASVMINEKMGCINRNSEIIIPFEFDALGEFIDGEIEYCFENKYGLMSKNLEIVVPCRYDSIKHFYEGICEFSLDMKRGVLDRFGNELISDYLIGIEYNRFN